MTEPNPILTDVEAQTFGGKFKTAPQTEDPPIKYTTPEEMEQYFELIEGEYHEINPHNTSKIRQKDIFYRVVHIHPQMHGIGMGDKNATAMAVVERYTKSRGPNGDWIRKPHRMGAEDDPAAASFTMKAKEFLEKYRLSERGE